MRKLDANSILSMKLFGDVTHTTCTDCFEANGTIIFIASAGNAGRAIGPQGKNIKLLRSKLNKNIKIFEEAQDCCQLIKNYLFPIKPKSCIQVDNNGKEQIEIEFNHSRERRFLLDSQQRALKELKQVINRYYPDIKDIRILQKGF